MPHLDAELPTWIGVGGSPESVIRVARYGFSLMLAIIGGPASRFAPFSSLFHQALEQFGHTPKPIGLHSPGHVAATDEQARDEFWPRYLEVIRRVSKTRGFAVPTEASFLREIGPIAATMKTVGANRFDLKNAMGGLADDALLTNIRLYGNEIVPQVRELLALLPEA